MREETIVKKWYQFDELSDKGKEKAIEKHWDWNVDFDWWQFTYEDAKTVGIDIQGFDIDRGSYCKIQFLWNAEQVADEILKQHGESCETYRIAKEFKEDFDARNDEEDDHEDLIEQFQKDLQEEFLSILRREYEYLTSEEAIRESLIANEVEFDGDLYEVKNV